ncbi:MAG: lipoprotein [Anaerotruncus massiliensis (ex Togo et al. 2019)]
MKKLLALILAIAMLATLAACGSTGGTGTPSTPAADPSGTTSGDQATQPAAGGELYYLNLCPRSPRSMTRCLRPTRRRAAARRDRRVGHLRADPQIRDRQGGRPRPLPDQRPLATPTGRTTAPTSRAPSLPAPDR